MTKIYKHGWHVLVRHPAGMVRTDARDDTFILVTVDADGLEHTPSGALVFWSHDTQTKDFEFIDRGRTYPLLILASGQWCAATIQDVMGYQNGDEVLVEADDHGRGNP